MEAHIKNLLAKWRWWAEGADLNICLSSFPTPARASHWRMFALKRRRRRRPVTQDGPGGKSWQSLKLLGTRPERFPLSHGRTVCLLHWSAKHDSKVSNPKAGSPHLGTLGSLWISTKKSRLSMRSVKQPWEKLSGLSTLQKANFAESKGKATCLKSIFLTNLQLLRKVLLTYVRLPGWRDGRCHIRAGILQHTLDLRWGSQDRHVWGTERWYHLEGSQASVLIRLCASQSKRGVTAWPR